jgi:CRISPR-associated protein Csm5
MKMPFECRQVRLTSPALFIGGRFGSFGPGEVAVDERTRRAYLLDREILARVALRRGMIKKLSDALRNQHAQDFYGTLVAICGADWVEIHEDGRPLVYATIGAEGYGPKTELYEAKPFVRNANGEAYVPGSSIKGAIRTATAYASLGLGTAPESFARQVSSRLHAGKVIREGFAKDIVEQRLQCGYDGNGTRSGANNDLLRCVHVSDSSAIGNAKLALRQSRIVYSGEQGGRVEGAPVVAEIACDVEVTFELTIDVALLQRYRGAKPFSSAAELLSLCRTFSSRIWQEDLAFFDGQPKRKFGGSRFATLGEYTKALQDFAAQRLGRPRSVEELKAFCDRVRPDFERVHGRAPAQARPEGSVETERRRLTKRALPEACPYNLRLGAGGGWLSKTMGVALENEARFKILCASYGGSSKKAMAPKAFEPVTRRLLRCGDGEIPMGWCKLEFVDEA